MIKTNVKKTYSGKILFKSTNIGYRWIKRSNYRKYRKRSVYSSIKCKCQKDQQLIYPYSLELTANMGGGNKT